MDGIEKCMILHDPLDLHYQWKIIRFVPGKPYGIWIVQAICFSEQDAESLVRGINRVEYLENETKQKMAQLKQRPILD